MCLTWCRPLWCNRPSLEGKKMTSDLVDLLFSPIHFTRSAEAFYSPDDTFYISKIYYCSLDMWSDSFLWYADTTTHNRDHSWKPSFLAGTSQSMAYGDAVYPNYSGPWPVRQTSTLRPPGKIFITVNFHHTSSRFIKEPCQLYKVHIHSNAN